MHVKEKWFGHEKGQPEYRRLLIALFAAGFATFAQLFGAQAVLPVISRDLGVPPSTAALTVSATTLGLGLSVLPWAVAADRLGRVRAMKISLVISAVVALITPLLPTLELVIVARVLVGASLGAVPAVAMAYLTEEIRRDLITLAASVYVVGNTLGGMTGRLIGGVVAEVVGWRAAFAAVAILVAVSAVLFSCLAPAPRGFAPERHRLSTIANRVSGLLRNPVLLGLCAHGFLLMGAFTAMYNYLGFRLLGAPFHVPATFVSLLFLAYLAGTVASRLAATFAARFGPRIVILYGALAMIAGAVLTLTSSLPVIFLGLVIFTMGCFSAQPLASGLSAHAVTAGRAQATALYQFAWLAGASLFGWLGGVLFGILGWSGVFGLLITLTASASLLAWASRRAT